MKPASSDNRRSSGTAVTRQGHQHRALETSIRPQLAGHVIAVHARQADIQQDNVRSKLLGQRQGLRPVVRDAHFAAQHAQQARQGRDRIGMVVDDEQPVELGAGAPGVGMLRARGRLDRPCSPAAATTRQIRSLCLAPR